MNLQANKLEPRATEPYVIEQVYANGTVIIRIAPNVIEHISLWRIKPYQQYSVFHTTGQDSSFPLCNCFDTHHECNYLNI